jgi:uncharacterized protein YraI
MITTGIDITSTTEANLRAGAGMAYGVVGVLSVGDKPLAVVGGPAQADGLVWWNVTYGGRSAWVAESVQGKPLIVPSTDLFELCVELVFAEEGGYVNDENDRGGVTRWGISELAYPQVDIPNLTRAKAKEIYRTDYWQRSGADSYPWPLCLAVLDTAVLHGVGQARAWAAESDGNVWRYLALRMASYTAMQSWHFHGAGWCNRVARLMKVCAA